MKLLLVAAAAVAAAASSVVADEFCGQWDTATAGDYIVYNNLWGASDDPAGNQCTGLDSHDGATIAWHTHFNWAGTSWQVKSYANAALKFDALPLESIASIPTTMDYTYSYDGSIVANVAYDLFTGSSVDGAIEFELMVWLAALGGAWPLSSSGSAVGTVTVDDVVFDLYQGVNGNTTVYSFVASEQTTSFSADLMAFFGYLVENKGFNASQYLTHVQCGTEPFTGTNANLTVLSYSAAVLSA